jgi:hypothetical protein
MITDSLTKLIEKQASLVVGLSMQTAKMMAKLWTPYRKWYDYDLTLSQAARSATTVEAAAKASRQRQRTYLRFIYRELEIPFPDPKIIDTDGGLSIEIPGGVDLYMRNGVTPLDVYQRPAEEFRYFKSKGLSDQESLDRAVQRAVTMSDTDLALTRRDENRRVFRNTPEVTGYRRIIHPERSQDGMSCGLCVVASMRVYHTDQLMPIHDECNCDVLPIVGDDDPGKELNDADYDLIRAIYKAAGSDGQESNDAGDLLKVKVSFTEHGELGPIISGGNRKGSKQRKAARESTPLTPEEVIDKQLHSLRKSSDKLMARANKGEDLAQPISWQRDRISLLERRLTAIRRQK